MGTPVAIACNDCDKMFRQTSEHKFSTRIWTCSVRKNYFDLDAISKLLLFVLKRRSKNDDQTIRDDDIALGDHMYLCICNTTGPQSND